MDAFRIRGGSSLSGEITVSGAKNAASKMMLASLLTADPVTLLHVPRQAETDITQELLTRVGAQVEWVDTHSVRITTATISASSVVGLSRKNRLSVLAIAPLLHRTGEAFVPKVGGDQIGPRPVNFHLDALQAMGAVIEERADGYVARVNGRLRGTVIDLPYPSVGATETAMLAGVLADGRTVIRNAAGEPEVKQLVMMLQNMGAMIQINSGRGIEITGVDRLHGCEMTIMPDRIEAASYACLALGTGGDIFVRGAQQEHMITFVNAVRKIGGECSVYTDGIRFRATRALRGIELETDTHPGFVTDWQQPFTVVLTQAQGISIVHETVYEDRFGYTETLRRMGADISLFSNCLGEVPCRFRGGNYRHSAVIQGPRPLSAAQVEIPDIRAGLAFVVAALMAEGTSVLTGVEHLDRGYEQLEQKLRSVGASLERVS